MSEKTLEELLAQDSDFKESVFGILLRTFATGDFQDDFLRTEGILHPAEEDEVVLGSMSDFQKALLVTAMICYKIGDAESGSFLDAFLAKNIFGIYTSQIKRQPEHNVLVHYREGFTITYSVEPVIPLVAIPLPLILEDMLFGDDCANCELPCGQRFHDYEHGQPDCQGTMCEGCDSNHNGFCDSEESDEDDLYGIDSDGDEGDDDSTDGRDTVVIGRGRGNLDS